MRSYQWGGLDKDNSLTGINKEGVFIDEARIAINEEGMFINEEDMFENIMGVFSRAIFYYKSEEQHKAKTLLVKFATSLPPNHLNYDMEYYNFIMAYYDLKENHKARKLAKAMVSKQIENLKRYNNLDTDMMDIDKHDANRNASTIFIIENLVSYYGHNRLASRFSKERIKYAKFWHL
jgi:hypothetical protein